MSDDLIAFLRERLDEDERVATAAQPGPWTAYRSGGTGVMGADARGVADRRGFDPHAQYETGEDLSAEDAAHIARHDPARVLAEVAAKRQQIDMTFRYEATIDGEWGCCHEAESIARGECPAIPVDDIRMLRLLALPYADHDGYRSEWAP